MSNKKQNLEFKLKLYFFFLPFGGESFFTSSSTEMGSILKEFKRRGAEKQYKEGVKYSISGMVFYLTLFVYFMITLV